MVLMFYCRCTHGFHVDCLVEFVRYNLKNKETPPFKCPGEGPCDVVLSHDIISNLPLTNEDHIIYDVGPDANCLDFESLCICYMCI